MEAITSVIDNTVPTTTEDTPTTEDTVLSVDVGGNVFHFEYDVCKDGVPRFRGKNETVLFAYVYPLLIEGDAIERASFDGVNRLAKKLAKRAAQSDLPPDDLNIVPFNDDSFVSQFAESIASLRAIAIESGGHTLSAADVGHDPLLVGRSARTLLDLFDRDAADETRAKVKEWAKTSGPVKTQLGLN